MSGTHILTPFWTTGATASANSEASATNTPASNLLIQQHSRKWRSNGLSTMQITLDATEARAFDTVFFGYHNGTSSGTIRITGNASTGTLFSSPTFDNGAVQFTFTGDLSAFSENHSWIQFASQTFRYIGIEISDATNPDGYVQAGVVMVGQDFEPTIGADLGSRFGGQQQSSEVELVNGEVIVRSKRHRNGMSLRFPKQREVDAMTWDGIRNVYSGHTPVVVKWDHPLTTTFQQHTIIYGRFDWGDDPFELSTSKWHFDFDVAIREV